MSVRIYALARDHDIPSKDVVDTCVQLGIEVKSHMSAISEEDAARVLQAIKNRAARPSVPAPGSNIATPTIPSPIRREDYIPASGVSGKVPDLGKAPPKPADDEKKAPPVLGRKSRPLPKVRPVAVPPPLPPLTSAKPEAAAPVTEKAQKPLMPLSSVVLRGAVKDRPPERPAAPPTVPPSAPTPPPSQSPSTMSPAAKQGPPPTKAPTPFEPPVPPKAAPTDKKPAKSKPATRRVEDEEEERPSHAHRPGAVAGREERQRKRGRRAIERKQTTDPIDLTAELTEEEAPPVPRPTRVRRRMGTAAGSTSTARPARAVLETPVSVRVLSETLGIKAGEIIRKLMAMNVMATINSTLEDDTAQMVAMELGIEIELRKPMDAEQQLEAQVTTDKPEDLVTRPPVVTFLGHVDHGKTSLLDALRKTNVVASEAGGITQHIGAHQVEHHGKHVTFLDTPGHEAFTAMRARGAHVTDVVVLVVAADDGIMPQTEEAISHARAAGVPIVVAVNKIDLPNANVQRVMQQLSSQGILPVQWGGDIEFVETSATSGQGLDKLLETIILTAELHELKANPNKPAVGTCLEASLHEGRGVLATLLVREGTLRRGDLVLCGQAYGRVKAMFDDHDRPIREALPATPVVVAGLDMVPEAGERFVVMEDLDAVRQVAEERRNRQRKQSLAERRHVTLETLFARISEDKVSELKLIVRADVRGSIEAIIKELAKLEHPEVSVRILHASVGAITESDVILADASDAVIVGFNVVPDERARSLAEDRGVEIRRYNIIYQLTEDIRRSLEGMLTPELSEVELGRALVQQVFKLSRVGAVAGCRVLQGVIERTGKVRLIRDGRVIYPVPGSGKEAPITSLKRVKDDVREVREGYECGIKIGGYDDIKEGDVIECYKIEETQRTL